MLVRAVKILDFAGAWLAGFTLLISLGSIAAQIFFRYVLNDSLAWAEEAARYALVWSTMIGAGVAYHRQSHVAVTLLAEKLPATGLTMLSCLVHATVAGIALLLVWYGTALTARSFLRAQLSPAMQIEIAWFYLAVPLGAALIFLAAVPIGFALAGASAVYILVTGTVPLSSVPQRIFAGLDQFILTSIPFYMLAGFVMNEAKLTHRLVAFADYLVGRWRGGLSQVTVVTSVFFGGISGSAAAEAAAIGTIMIPSMERAGYRRDFATAVTVCASIVGPLIPPSIPMLVYGIASGASIGALFLAGITPGLFVGLGMLSVNRFLTRNVPLRSERPILEGKAPEGFGSTFRGALSALLLPVLIFSGVAGGAFTPTESAVAAVVYAIAIGFVLRTLRRSALWRLIVATSLLSATVMFIIASANLLGWVLAVERIPQLVAAMFLQLTEVREVFILLVILLLLITGLFLETSGAIVILVPVLLPAAQAYGIDVVHFGVIMVFGLVIGLVTPPVGLCLFVGSSVGKVPIPVLVRATLPFVGMMLVLLVAFAFFPSLSLWLPRMLNL